VSKPELMTIKSFKGISTMEGKPKEEVVKMRFEKLGLKYEDGDYERVMVVRASNGEVDSDGDIIDPRGWVNMGKFMQNPVLLHNHNAYSEDPIGAVLETTIAVRQDAGPHDHQKSELQALVYFDRSTKGQAVLDKYMKGTMRAFSVRFRPLKFRDITDDQRNEYKMGRYGNYIAEQELIELSAVGLPSNRDAIVLEKAAKEELSKSVKDMAHEINELKTCVKGLESLVKTLLAPKEAKVIETHSALLADILNAAKPVRN